jgi:hypothetical protein
MLGMSRHCKTDGLCHTERKVSKENETKRLELGVRPKRKKQKDDSVSQLICSKPALLMTILS